MNLKTNFGFTSKYKTALRQIGGFFVLGFTGLLLI